MGKYNTNNKILPHLYFHRLIIKMENLQNLEKLGDLENLQKISKQKNLGHFRDLGSLGNLIKLA